MCFDGFDDLAAVAACQDLGYETGEAVQWPFWALGVLSLDSVPDAARVRGHCSGRREERGT